MTDLAEKKCIPCEGGIPSFNIEEIHKYLKKVDGWDVNSADKKDFYIVKEFKFNNFLESSILPSPSNCKFVLSERIDVAK